MEEEDYRHLVRSNLEDEFTEEDIESGPAHDLANYNAQLAKDIAEFIVDSPSDPQM